MSDSYKNTAKQNNMNWLSQMVMDNPIGFFAFMDGLVEERYSIRQIGINKQELQFWKTNKLIDVPEPSTDKREWLKVSFFQLFWLKIIDELRKLGVPFETIKDVQKMFFSLGKEDLDIIITHIQTSDQLKSLKELIPEQQIQELLKASSEIYSYLQEKINRLIIFTLALLDTNAPTYLIIEPGKEPEILMLADAVLPEINLNEYFLRNASFYCIYLNPLLADYFQNIKIKEDDLQKTFKLSKAEKQIIHLFRKEGIKELRVKFNASNKKGELMVEVVENTDVKAMESKCAGILEKGKFKQIRIQTEGKRLVFIEQTTKVKIKND